MASTIYTSFVLGEILGHIALPASVTDVASAFAAKSWDAAEAQEFCGDAVETFALPDAFPSATEPRRSAPSIAGWPRERPQGGADPLGWW